MVQSEPTAFMQPYLIVQRKPPPELTLPENTKHTLKCEVTGVPRPSITWLKDGKKVFQVSKLNEPIRANANWLN